MKARTQLRCVLGAALLSIGCVGQPGQLCDRENLVFAVDEFVFDSSHDVNPDQAGLQIDVLVKSTLDPGVVGELIVSTEDMDIVHDESPVADADGQFQFHNVTLPVGPLSLILRSNNGCRDVQATRNVFAYDELGFPACRVVLDAELGSSPALSHPALNASADTVPGMSGLQASITVETGRPDMDVVLLVRDTESGEEQTFNGRAGDELAVTTTVTIADGTVAIRAICTWELYPDPPTSSASHLFVVDTVAPECALVSPATRVDSEDDIDIESPDIQFELRGTVTGDDTVGELAEFTVEGTVVPGGTIDGAGAAGAVGTYGAPPPGSQTLSFTAHDHAGNTCTAEVTF